MPKLSAKARWCRSFSNQEIEPADSTTWNFSAEDIIQGLAKQSRYSGQITGWYSVGEHSWQLCRWAQYHRLSTNAQRYALLHDSSEAVLGADVPGPWKVLVPEWKELERKVTNHLLKRFRVYRSEPIEIADVRILINERRMLYPADATKREWFPGSEELEPLGTPVLIQQYSWSEMIVKLRDEFNRLGIR